MRLLAKKTDELTTLASSECVYPECSLLCFTETWLNDNIPDCAIELAGFTLARADRGQQSCK
ncbi:hypothetical protein N1851_017240 [Merluccius polli]|uniref:Uncharacterized protein n=1 Tax=Merluccius polli TaxID=89951 RepID=A0AA47MQS0_MERPO|nr:hypothetical protein N1851_017240 [Merluccius polli]